MYFYFMHKVDPLYRTSGICFTKVFNINISTLIYQIRKSKVVVQDLLSDRYNIKENTSTSQFRIFIGASFRRIPIKNALTSIFILCANFGKIIIKDPFL